MKKICLSMLAVALSLMATACMSSFGKGNAEADYEVTNVQMPTGRQIQNLYLFSNAKNYQKYWNQVVYKKFHKEEVQWWPKYLLDDDDGKKFKIWRNAKIAVDEDGFFRKFYSLSQCGTMGSFMKENGYNIGLSVFQSGSSLIVALLSTENYSEFSYIETLYVDDSVRQAFKEAKQQAKEQQAREILGTKVTGSSYNSPQWYWHSSGGGGVFVAGLGGQLVPAGESFWYRVVYDAGTYSYCITRSGKWYLHRESGEWIVLSASDVPTSVRTMAE